MDKNRGEYMNKMFKVLKFKVINFLDVNDIEIEFYNNENYLDKNFSCTLVIGENGSGKTELAIKLIDAFLDLDKRKQGIRKRKNQRSFDYELVYYLNDYKYEVVYENSVYKFKKNGNSSSLEELILPQKIIAQSFSFADKFNFNSNDRYSYLGTRTASNASYVSHFQNTIAEIISKNIYREDFKIFFKDLLIFLNFDKKIGLAFNISSKRKLEAIQSDYKMFENLYENFKSRRTNSEVGINIEKSNLKEVHNKLIKYIKKYKGLDNNEIIYEFSLDETFKNKDLFEFYTFMRYLSYFKILSNPNIIFSKYEQNIHMDVISSGEKQMIYSFLSIYSTIDSNSLVVIDEPEISLHPNWQMKYLNLLETLFSKYVNSHFIIATHSHFMVSDLKKDNSSIIVMNRNAEKLSAYKYDSSTYGWSAEDILYNVFRVPSNRNYYIAKDVEEIAKAISMSNIDKNIEHKINILKKLLPDLNDNDPLKTIITNMMKVLDEKKI